MPPRRAQTCSARRGGRESRSGPIAVVDRGFGDLRDHAVTVVDTCFRVHAVSRRFGCRDVASLRCAGWVLLLALALAGAVGALDRCQSRSSLEAGAATDAIVSSDYRPLVDAAIRAAAVALSDHARGVTRSARVAWLRSSGSGSFVGVLAGCGLSCRDHRRLRSERFERTRGGTYRAGSGRPRSATTSFITSVEVRRCTPGSAPRRSS